MTHEKVVKSYGDLIFDLCESLLWSQTNAQIAFRDILKRLTRIKEKPSFYDKYERAWILSIVYRRLLVLAEKYSRKLTPSEQIMLDSTLDSQGRMKQMNSYFHRLDISDQFLLLLKDKHRIHYSEISAAMGIPEGSLKIMRQQALCTLESWIWNR